jgi:hypothetical protein
MSNNKQSSVEWLDKQLASLNFDYITGQVSNKEYNDKSKQILKKAKAMHKEEIEKAWVGGKNCLNGEQYYNQTYGGNK